MKRVRFLCLHLIKKRCHYHYNRIVLLSTAEQVKKRIPFKLADIGEGIAEVELLKWFVKEGDNVKSFDRICEVQSDKATVEITSRYDGIISSVHHAEGSIVKVGESLIDIDVIDTGRSKLITDNSEPVLHGGNKPSNSTSSNDEAVVKEDHDDINDRVLTTPAVRKIAKENNINLLKVNPTGPKGRILKEDVIAYVNGTNKKEIFRPSTQSPSTGHTSTSISTSTVVKNTAEVTISSRPTNERVQDADKVVPIRGVQRIMVKSMTAALQVQHLTYSDEFVVDQLINLRKVLKVEAEKRNIRISYMPFIIKATSLALEQFPMLNATVNADVSAMTYHSNHNIGVAMDSSKGLVVPVIKNVQTKSIFEIAQELTKLQESVQNGTISESHLTNGTFSLSNIGSIGGTYTVPVVVVPQVAIGAFGKQQIVPRYINPSNGGNADPDLIYSGKAAVQPVTIMNISWSADHRVIDGATVARFSNLFKSYIETPSLMLGLMK